MKGFFEKVQKNLQINVNGTSNQYRGGGKSLGGSKPGKLIHVSLPNPGQIGVKVEKSSNGRGYAIISQVVPGSQAADANLQRGDIVCHAGSEGEEEIMYDQFIQMSASSRRPLIFDVRRLSAIQSTSVSTNETSAEAYSRKQAIIAAAESRDKSQKAKARPIKKTLKSNATDVVSKRNKTMSPSDNEQVVDEDIITDIPMSNEATLQAVQDAKNREIDLANNLGYNPFNTMAMNSGQARNAKTVANHGNIETENSYEQDVPSMNLDTNISQNGDAQVCFNEAFEESFTVFSTTNESNASLSQSLAAMRKLIINATTKGQQGDVESAKFRKVRLSNAKIRNLICEMYGAIELLISVGFHLAEDLDKSSERETFLVYPEGNSGPTWLGKALKMMEQYERNIS